MSAFVHKKNFYQIQFLLFLWKEKFSVHIRSDCGSYFERLRTFPGCCQLLVSGWKDYCPPIAAEACGEPFLRRNYLRLYCRNKPLHRNFGESMAALVVYIISIMAAAIISILYSYLFYKKKLATGEGLKIQYNTKKV